MRQKEPIAGRVDPEIKRKIKQIVDEVGVSESEIVRRGMTNYVETNPDRYKALGPQDMVGQLLEELE